MKKKPIRLLSAAMSLALALGLLGGCSANVEEHDHADDAAELTEGVTLELLADEGVPLAGGTCEEGHDFRSTGAEIGYDCSLGKVEFQVYTCSRCGAYYHTAVRKADKDEPAPGGDHSTSVITLNGCPSNPGKIRYCDECDYRTYDGGGAHKWTEWEPDTKDTCNQSYNLTRECTACNTTQTRSHAANGHSWRIISETEATCTEGSEIVRECNVCHTRETAKGQPLGHQYQIVDGDCEADRKCARCGDTVRSPGHQYDTTYESDSNGHWQVCLNCKTAGKKNGSHRYRKRVLCLRIQDPLLQSRLAGDQSVRRSQPQRKVLYLR